MGYLSEYLLGDPHVYWGKASSSLRGTLKALALTSAAQVTREVLGAFASEDIPAASGLKCALGIRWAWVCSLALSGSCFLIRDMDKLVPSAPGCSEYESPRLSAVC